MLMTISNIIAFKISMKQLLLATQYYSDRMAMFTNRYKLQQHLAKCGNMCKAKWRWNRLRNVYLFTLTKIWNLLIHIHMFQFIFTLYHSYIISWIIPQKCLWDTSSIPLILIFERMLFILVISRRLFI